MLSTQSRGVRLLMTCLPLIVRDPLGQDEHPARSLVPEAPTSGLTNPLTAGFTALPDTAPATTAIAVSITSPRRTNPLEPVGDPGIPVLLTKACAL